MSLGGATADGYPQTMSPRPALVTELTGAAAEAVEAARQGHDVLLTVDGRAVASIVPALDELDVRLPRVAGRFKTKGPLGPEAIDDAIAEAVGR